MKSEHLIHILEEQVSVGFTGKINAQNKLSKQHLGFITILDGEIINCIYKGASSLKAFYSLCIDEFESKDLSYVVEPELVDGSRNNIHYPYSVLKRKIADVVEGYRKSNKNRPPGELKIIIKPEFITSGDGVSESEYSLLNTMSDFNRVDDIYKYSKLLDFEVTNSLVSLRKKNALKVIKTKELK